MTQSIRDAAQPTADERVAELMRLVDDAVTAAKALAHSPTKANSHWLNCSEEAVEQSARALLSAAQEDAEHAAMYRWIREHGEPDAGMAYRPDWTAEMYDAAIRSAMGAKETK